MYVVGGRMWWSCCCGSVGVGDVDVDAGDGWGFPQGKVCSSGDEAHAFLLLIAVLLSLPDASRGEKRDLA